MRGETRGGSTRGRGCGCGESREGAVGKGGGTVRGSRKFFGGGQLGLQGAIRFVGCNKVCTVLRALHGAQSIAQKGEQRCMVHALHAVAIFAIFGRIL